VTDVCFNGLTASPFQLKMQALADYSDCSWQRWPDQAPSRGSARRQHAGLLWAKARGKVQRFPVLNALDEYPSVPFYRIDDGPWYYDSTGFALHLDALGLSASRPLAPGDPALAFVTRLIDEAFDEFGLYMVHHMRWAGTGRTTPMPQMTVAELRLLLPGFLHGRFTRGLEARQSRRCPYLFSVAPEGFDLGIAGDLTPPSLPGFPETHSLLNSAWRSYLAAMESLLSSQPFLLGDRFTLADASAYGQLSMNLVDGAPATLLRELAPATFDWLCAIRDGGHCGSDGALYLSGALKPLLDIIGRTFVPLMEQNEAAYSDCIARGETVFNETAFDAGRALYDGELMGHPFRAVVKTFQVRVWRELVSAWENLPEAVAGDLRHYLGPGLLNDT
jgi:glutathione S-transferase